MGFRLTISELEITARFETLGVDAPRLLGEWPTDLRGGQSVSSTRRQAPHARAILR